MDQQAERRTAAAGDRGAAPSATGAGRPRPAREAQRPRLGLLTSMGETLDSFFVEIVDRWRRDGLDVRTAAGDASRAFPEQTVVPGVSRAPGPSSLRALAALRRWVHDAQIDLVVTNTATASALVRLARVDARVIYFCHGLHWDGDRLRDAPFRLVERLLLARTDGIICMNGADERWFREHAPQIPLLRVHGGVGLDVERFARRPRSPWTPGQRLRLVWCGEFVERKNPAAAVTLVEELTRRGIAVELTMLGTGALRPTIEDRVAGSPAIRLAGHVDPRPAFARAHALVQTARWEGLPRVALEAVAMGLPTAGFDVKGVRDIPCAEVAPAGDVEALADAVLRAASASSADLPDPQTLSYAHAADAVARFAERIHRRGAPVPQVEP